MAQKGQINPSIVLIITPILSSKHDYIIQELVHIIRSYTHFLPMPTN